MKSLVGVEREAKSTFEDTPPHSRCHVASTASRATIRGSSTKYVVEDGFFFGVTQNCLELSATANGVHEILERMVFEERPFRDISRST